MRRRNPVFSRALSNLTAIFAPRQRYLGAMRRRALRPLFVSVATLALLSPFSLAHSTPAAARASLPINLTLQPSVASPQPVGTPIVWIASATDFQPLVYQFSVASAPSGPFTVVRDFYSRNDVVWAPIMEGTYYVQVTAKEGYTGTATATATASFTLTSRVTNGQPVVRATANPLVALYSAPACSAGEMNVRFAPASDPNPVWTDSNVEPCQSGQDLNFLVAGMLPHTSYQMESVLNNGGSVTISTPILFTTGSLPSGLTYPQFTVPTTATSQSDQTEFLTFHSLLWPWTGEVNPVATDLKGNILWYAFQPDLGHPYATRIQPLNSPIGAVVALQGNDGQAVADDLLRFIDLAGNPVQETNMFAINQQLAALGQRQIYGFSHDSFYLPNGNIAVIAYTQQWVGGKSYMGDMVIVLDPNMRVVWTWDAFNYLSTSRGPTLGDICAWSYSTCPVPGGSKTVDWTHTNAVSYSPSDGNLIISIRSQDWVIKVNYANGSGDGAIIWRLGKGGDFTLVPLNPRDAYPWFSHQHDANYIDGSTLELFDNGNTRCVGKRLAQVPCNSRGQVYALNEQTMVATQTINVDLGAYSNAVGTAQQLPNGNYNFTLGILGKFYAQDIEVLPNGTQVFVQQLNAWEYRAWRLDSLDEPINASCPECS